MPRGRRIREEGADYERMIHVRLPDETHRRLRVRVAQDDTSIQEWVAQVVERELEKAEGEKGGGGGG